MTTQALVERLSKEYRASDADVGQPPSRARAPGARSRIGVRTRSRRWVGIIHGGGCSCRKREGQGTGWSASRRPVEGFELTPMGESQRAKVASASRRPERVSHQPTSTRRVTSLRPSKARPFALGNALLVPFDRGVML